MQDKLFFNPGPNERQAVAHLRQVFSKELAEHPRINTHWYLLRFYRARQGKMPKVEKMFKDYLEWRNSEIARNVDKYDKHTFDALKKIHIRGTYGTTKDNLPLVIERIDKTDIPAFLDPEFNEIRKDYFFDLYEKTLHISFPMASQHAGKRIDSFFVIYDLKGVNFAKLFNSNFKKYVKFLIGLVQANYPEILSKFFIINASSSFLFIWNIMKWWLDKVTRAKIEVCKGIPLDKLEKYIDINQIPDFLGGKCTEKLSDNHGPWKEMFDRSYEIKSFDLEDMTPRYQYFMTKDEYEEIERKNSTKGNQDQAKESNKLTTEMDMSYGFNTEGGIGEIRTLNVRIKNHSLTNI